VFSTTQVEDVECLSSPCFRWHSPAQTVQSSV